MRWISRLALVFLVGCTSQEGSVEPDLGLEDIGVDSGAPDQGGPAPDGGDELDLGAEDLGSPDLGSPEIGPPDMGPLGCVPKSPIRISPDGADPGSPRIVPLQEGYLVVWSDTDLGSVQGVQIDYAGNVTRAARSLTPGLTGGSNAELILNAQGAALVYQTSGERIELARINGDGDLVGAPSRVSDSGYGPDIVWTGERYGVVFRSPGDLNVPGQLHLRQLDENGDPIGDEAPLTNIADGTNGGDITWNGAHYGIGFSVRGEEGWRAYFARVDTAGTVTGTITQIHDGTSIGVRVSSDGTDFLTTFSGGGAPARWGFLSDEGQPLGGTFELGRGVMPSIWTGNNYAFAWSNLNPAFPVQLVTMGPGGRNLTQRDISFSGEIALNPSVAWDGEGYGLVWNQSPEPQSSAIYFARACPEN